jgi:coenzyme F420-dependent glucose-6-phosphate dehydrogenase
VIELGYGLSCEEHSPAALVQQARWAEEAGFGFAIISDHYHPWLERQGNSGFVWSVIGAIAAATDRITVGTGVTCPILRIHPAIIGQAAATSAELLPGRFFLGVGTGENLNEHILGGRWPPAAVRLKMLEEAVRVIRQLWQGANMDFRGEFFVVENARIYTLPDRLPPIYIAAAGARAARLAARAGDGLIAMTPNRELVGTFKGEGNGGPRYGQVAVCWADSEQEARKTAQRIWPTAALSGSFEQELPSPAHFEELVAGVTEEDVARSVVCGPDPDKYVDAVREFADAGFDHIALRQIGPEQAGFFGFYKSEVLPRISRSLQIEAYRS